MSAPARRQVRARILVVEDEPYVRQSLVEVLRSRGYDVAEAGSVAEAQALLPRSPVDLVLTDLRMPGADGRELVRRLRESAPELPVVVLTGHGTIDSAVECLKEGAADYLLKPAEPDSLELSLERALAARALRREVDYLRRAATGPERSIGESAGWRRVVGMVEAAAPADSPVLLLGESGTGKEVLARLLHRASPRASGPYVRVNCAAVPVEMWESEFFGHRRGAFTGAAADREGRFQLAHRGTLFLDEVGAMPAAAQAKLLRVIQDGEFDRLGDVQPTRVDVRIVAATNSDLEAEVAAGRFRADLYYRLNVLRIPVPPLRERPDDLPPLAAAFAAEVAARCGRPAPALSPEIIARFQAYAWPGNVRELRSMIERAVVLGLRLDEMDLASAGGAPAAEAPGPDAGDAAQPLQDLNLRDALNRLERRLLLEAHRRSGGVRKEAARLLGIDPRNLGYYFHKHGIAPE